MWPSQKWIVCELNKSAAELTPFKYVCTTKHNDMEMLL